MMKLAGILLAAVGAAALGAGCTTPYVQSLTVTRVPRNPAGLYPVEAQWETDQSSLRPDSLEGWAIVGDQSFPMYRVLNSTNRWEGVIQVPADQNFVYYHFKFDYLYNAFSKAPKPGSARSAAYTMEIRD